MNKVGFWTQFWENLAKKNTRRDLRKNGFVEMFKLPNALSPVRKMSPKVKFLYCLLFYAITFFSSFLMQGERFRKVVCKQLDNFTANFASWLCRANERGEIFSRAMVIFQKALLIILITLFSRSQASFCNHGYTNHYFELARSAQINIPCSPRCRRQTKSW